MLNKDFYDKLPGFVCEALDDLIEQYEAESWFDTAWEEYRKYVLGIEDIFDIRMPGFIFNKYIKEIE